MKLTAQLGPGVAPVAGLGLVVLQNDEVVEQEFRRLLPASGVALHTARVPSGTEVTSETLAAMERELPRAVSLLPPAARIDVIGYACTSGATIIGEDRVTEAVRSQRPEVAVTNPLTAAKAALTAAGLGRIAFVSPYVASVSLALRQALEAAGFAVAGLGSFELAAEADVARVDGASLLDAIVTVAESEPCDGVFVSCTNLAVLDVLEAAQRRLGLPVLSSNLALAWHMFRLAGLRGRLALPQPLAELRFAP